LENVPNNLFLFTANFALTLWSQVGKIKERHVYVHSDKISKKMMENLLNNLFPFTA